MNPRLLARCLSVLGSLLLLGVAACAAQPGAGGKASAGTPLFPEEGIPVGWSVRNWVDVSQAPPPGAQWVVTDGILRGSTPRGTWLMSEREYGDFSLEYEFRLGERGNSGFAFRFPPSGDPAVTGMELQLVDPRFYGSNYIAQPSELTGALYKALPPSEQVLRPLDWNTCKVTCAGPNLTVVLNGRTVIDTDLSRQQVSLPGGLPLAQRPRRGHIGFQEISRGGGFVEIRNARIQAAD